MGATSPFPFGILDLSAVTPGVVRVFGVDITVGSEVRTLTHVPFEDRASFGGPSATGVPTSWFPYGHNKIGILPPASSAYVYVVHYLPTISDLTSAGSTFDGVAGWEDYITWDVVCRLVIRDQYPQSFAMASQYKEQIWSNILRSATRMTNAGGAILGRDTMGARGLLSSGRKTRLPPP